ncbi:MAG: hypothetical protein P8P87_01665 [Crocinitomicaceae bacterium]|nr:hypothetical protein [Crocinitomicaceae bacterium]
MTDTIDEVGKIRAIVAHITLIGWIIAIVQNNPKNDFASFYIRQMLGLLILALGMQVLSMLFAVIPFLGFIMSMIFMLGSLGVVALWVISLIGAVNGKKEPTPFIGQSFQDWFNSM